MCVGSPVGGNACGFAAYAAGLGRFVAKKMPVTVSATTNIKAPIANR